MPPFSFFQRTGMLPQLAYSMHTLPQETMASPSSSSGSLITARSKSQQANESPGSILADGLVEKLTDALRPILVANQKDILDRITVLDTSVRALVQEVASFKEQAAQTTKSHPGPVPESQLLAERLDRLDSLIGVSSSVQNGLSLADRLDLLALSTGQLLQHMQNSDVPARIRHEIGINTVSLPPTPGRDPRTEPHTGRNEIERRSLCPQNSRPSFLYRFVQSPATGPPQPETLVPVDWFAQGHPDDEGLMIDADADDSAAASQSSSLPPRVDSGLCEQTVSSPRTQLFDILSASLYKHLGSPSVGTAPSHSRAEGSTPSFTTPLDTLTELSTSPPECLNISPPPAATALSPPRLIEATLKTERAATPEDTKSQTCLSRSLSPLSSISSSDGSQPTAFPRTRITLKSTINSPGIKKRKTKRRLTMPPAKRPRKKSVLKGNKSFSILSEVEWPKKTNNDDTFHRTFIQCDRCHVWYHCGCVGVDPGDVRLEPTEIYICPACTCTSHEKTVVKKDADRQQECARPDCDHPRQGEYFVERIVGRAPRMDRVRDDGKYSEAQRYLWLVKWDGYSITEATWESDEQMIDPQTLVAEFNNAAKEEGINLTGEGIVVLWEAEEGGWKPTVEA